MTKHHAPLRETVRISAELLEQYRLRAREEGRTLSGLIDLILRADLSKKKGKRDGYEAGT